MPMHDIVVIGASAGGVEALIKLTRLLPADLPAAVFVVVHFPTDSVSVLPQILNRAKRLAASHARQGEPFQPGRIYVAPTNRHLLLGQGAIRLVTGPREHGFRPAIDPLFRSAARAFGPRVVGVILSGTLSDGMAGLRFIKERDGVALVQDPQEALFPNMLLHAIENVPVDEVLPLAEIAETLVRLAYQPISKEEFSMIQDENSLENQFVQEDIDSFVQGVSPNGRSVLTCPECGGVLWELEEGQLLRYRCHVGHVYSNDSLLIEQGETLEDALWTAVRALVERRALLERLVQRAIQRNSPIMAERFRSYAQEAERQADVIRKVLYSGKSFGLDLEAMDKDIQGRAGDPPSGEPAGV